jgi:hypothetical protein
LPKKTLLNDVWIQQKRTCLPFPFWFVSFTNISFSLSAEDVIKRLEEEHAAAVRQVKELEESLERLTDAKHELFVHLKSSLREEEKRKEEEKQRVLAAQQQFFAQQQQQYQQYLQQLQQQQQQQQQQQH